MKNRATIVKITESAIMVALAFVLSLIIVFKQPNGGSITALSMLPVVVIGFRYGIRWGAFTGVVFGALNLLMGIQDLRGISMVSFIGAILLDFLLAFVVLGFAGGVASKIKAKQIIALPAGVLLAGALRFFAHFLSGILIWGSYAPEGQPVWIYSFVYNISYMLPETVLTLIGAVLISAVLDFKSPNLIKK